MSSFIFQYRILCLRKYSILCTPNYKMVWSILFLLVSDWSNNSCSCRGIFFFWASLLLEIFMGSKLTWNLWASIYTEKICPCNCLKTTIFAELISWKFYSPLFDFSSELYWNLNVWLKRRGFFICSSYLMEIYF